MVKIEILIMTHHYYIYPEYRFKLTFRFNKAISRYYGSPY